MLQSQTKEEEEEDSIAKKEKKMSITRRREEKNAKCGYDLSLGTVQGPTLRSADFCGGWFEMMI